MLHADVMRHDKAIWKGEVAKKMKDSGLDWLGLIPERWRLIKGKYLFTERTSRGNEKSLLLLSPTQKYGVVPQALYEQLSGMKAVKLEESMELSSLKTIYEGDFCISLRSFQGGFEYSHYDGVVSPAYHVFYKTSELDNEYYRWMFKEKGFISKMASFTKTFRDGKSISFDDFANSLIPVPPIWEQTRIAQILDNECARIDEVIEQTRVSIEEYKKLKQSIITEAVTKGIRKERPMKGCGIEWIGEIPEEWDLIKAKYLFRQRSEKGNRLEEQLLSPTQKYGVIPQSMYDDISGMKAVKLDERIDYAELKGIYSGDFCISLRSFQGGFEYSEYNGVVSPAYQVFYKTGDNIYNYYFKRLFKEKGFIKKMASLTKSFREGKNIAFGDFANSLIPIPPYKEQVEIAAYIDLQSSEIDRLIEAKQKMVEEMQNYKKSLIYEYVTGKKEV